MTEQTPTPAYPVPPALIRALLSILQARPEWIAEVRTQAAR